MRRARAKAPKHNPGGVERVCTCQWRRNANRTEAGTEGDGQEGAQVVGCEGDGGNGQAPSAAVTWRVIYMDMWPSMAVSISSSCVGGV
jgi:hypothetical protein